MTSTSPAVPDGQPLSGYVVPGTGNGNHPAPSQEDLTTHGFFNVLRHLVRSVPHVNEQEVETALQIMDDMETHSLASPVAHVTTDQDIAKREDVTLRQAPQTGALVPVAGPPLDYNRLAAALLAAQQAQNAPPSGGEGTGSEPA